MSTAGMSMRRGSSPFADPYDDLAGLSAPQTLADATTWAERVLMRNGLVTQAWRRVAAYFITNIQVTQQKSSRQESLGSEEREKYESFLTDQMKIRSVAHQAAFNYLTYGRHYIQVIQPMRRSLSCPGCRAKGTSYEAPLAEIANNPACGFQWQNYEFHATCPYCEYRGAWRRIDRRSTEPLYVKHHNPHEIEVSEACDGNKQYTWKIGASLKKRVKDGIVHELERIPWEIVEAIRDNAFYKFNPGIIYDMTYPGLAGHDLGGHGLPPMLANFRLVWHEQVLRRFNEAIAVDYIIPARVITPEPRSSADGVAGDPFFNVAGGQFVSFVNNMIRKRQKDPAAWMVAPFSMKYQTLGGDAKQFAPVELLEQAKADLLNAMGIPMELYQGTLTQETAPAALRLFEAFWSHLVDHLNGLVSFIADKIAQFKSWEPVDARFLRVTHADDLNRQMAILQLMQARQVSADDALKTLGLEFRSQQEKILEEEAYVAERTRKYQEEAAEEDSGRQMHQQAAQVQAGVPGQPSGQAAAPGAPPANGMPTDPSQLNPQDLMAYANQIATDLMGRSEAQRKAELVALRSSDKTGALVALVTAQMDKIRRDAQRSGGQQVLAQQFGQGQQPQQAPPQQKAASILPWTGKTPYEIAQCRTRSYRASA